MLRGQEMQVFTFAQRWTLVLASALLSPRNLVPNFRLALHNAPVGRVEIRLALRTLRRALKGERIVLVLKVVVVENLAVVALIDTHIHNDICVDSLIFFVVEALVSMACLHALVRITFDESRGGHVVGGTVLD